jgi:hypothetical protein
VRPNLTRVSIGWLGVVGFGYLMDAFLFLFCCPFFLYVVAQQFLFGCGIFSPYAFVPKFWLCCVFTIIAVCVYMGVFIWGVELEVWNY